MSTSHEQTMKERSSVYGKYIDGLEAEAAIMTALLDFHAETHGKEMGQLHQQYIQKIVMKLTRVAVTPDHVDSWHDISNYARLTEEAIKHERAITTTAGTTRAAGREGSSDQSAVRCYDR